MHPADTADRREIAQDDFGLGLCNITKCCTEVCPENIKITDNAIIPMKERVVDTKYDPVLFLGSKIGMRKDSGRTKVGPAGGSGPSPIKHPEQRAGGEAFTARPAEADSTLRKAAIPAAATGGAAGVGILAWLLRRRRAS
jgi:hypothetical protein